MSYPPRSVSGMNPARRRRVNFPGPRCQCAECQALADGTYLDPEARMRAVAEDIRSAGWSVAAVAGGEIAPPWAYTIGLWLSYCGPELALFGLPVEHMTVILNSAGDRIADGEAIEAGGRLDGICPCPLELRPVHASWRATCMFAVSDRYHGYIRPAFLQVVWPDRKGRYPGDPGFQARYDGRQPMLWLPRDDHPPGVWTRIDQLC
jgi:hypothetical protein